MRRIYSALLALLLCVSLPALALAACGHAALSTAASTIIAANDVLGPNNVPIGGRHGLCIYNNSTTINVTFAIANQGLPAWQVNHVYVAGQMILDSNGNQEIVTTAGTSGTGAHPTWTTTAGLTTTDGTVTWTLMTIGVAAISGSDWTLLPAAANNGVEAFECFYEVGNALVPGGAVSAIAASSTPSITWCSW